MTGILSATTNSGDDGNLTSVGDGTRESTRIPDVFVTDENIDVLPHMPLLCCDAIPNARIDCPERRQRLSQGLRWVLDLDSTVSCGKFTQCARNVKSDRHESPLRSTRLAFRLRWMGRCRYFR